MSRRLRVAFYGAGQVGTGAAEILRLRPDIDVLGPFGRASRETALTCGADVIVIATTSFLSAVAGDISEAIESGSNVITTAEEAAYPWASDAALGSRLDALARRHGVTVLGTGLNPGFAFDALVLTASGAVSDVESLVVERVVDLSGFGEAVLRRIGVGHSRESFEDGRRAGTVTGHIGFPQSMRVVAGKLGVAIERIDAQLEPVFAEHELTSSSLVVAPGETAGFRQRYTSISAGRPWFVAVFTGHLALNTIDEAPRDTITIASPSNQLRLEVLPGINPQSGSASIVANSVRRVVAAPPGWATVGELPPAVPV